MVNNKSKKASIAIELYRKVTWSIFSLAHVQKEGARSFEAGRTNNSGRLKPKNLLFLTLKLKKKNDLIWM